MSIRPDAPIGSSSDDLLGRQPFVDEIVDIAINTPKEWAPRIGIYGSWGSGKTSVLNMIAERLGEAHHVVAQFNPWGFSDADEMFGALADAILKAIEEQGDEIKKPARKGEKITKAVQKGLKVADQATKQAGDVGVPGARVARGVIAMADYVNGVLRRVFEKKKIRELLERLGALSHQTRCIVLVDDIDRAEPALLPPLLFALHEVLVAVPITFVIALDPTVVGAALKVHHPGFGDGLAFLEKMIQFPRWLPDVTDDDRRRLAMKDVEQYLPVLDRDAVRQEFDRFPSNPRELRTFLRGMWGLNLQAARYRDGEISWNLVLRLAVLRQKHRRVLDVLLDDENLLTRVAGFHLTPSRRKRDEESDTDLAVEATLRERGGRYRMFAGTHRDSCNARIDVGRRVDHPARPPGGTASRSDEAGIRTLDRLAARWRCRAGARRGCSQRACEARAVDLSITRSGRGRSALTCARDTQRMLGTKCGWCIRARHAR